MKKLVLLIAAVLMITAILAGCKKDEPAPTESTESQSPTAADTQAPSKAEETTAAAPVKSSDPVDPSWFNDAVFIGDSITVALNYACADDPGLLGSAQFVCSQSLGYHNALWDLDTEGAVHPTYKGETVLAETAASITGAKKVFILLGVNDIGTYGADDTFEKAETLIGRILSYTPDVKIYCQSTTPMLDDKESGWLNNEKICDFNEKLKAYCDEKGYGFIDVYHQLCDENGDLKEEYCGDPDVQGIHFNTEGCRIWAEHLKAAVGELEGASQTSSHTASAASAAAGAAGAMSAPEPTAAAVTEAEEPASSSQSYTDDDVEIIYYSPNDSDSDAEDDYSEDDDYSGDQYDDSDNY